jgi:hypothetical protein
MLPGQLLRPLRNAIGIDDLVVLGVAIHLGPGEATQEAQVETGRVAPLDGMDERAQLGAEELRRKPRQGFPLGRRQVPFEEDEVDPFVVAGEDEEEDAVEIPEGPGERLGVRDGDARELEEVDLEAVFLLGEELDGADGPPGSFGVDAEVRGGLLDPVLDAIPEAGEERGQGVRPGQIPQAFALQVDVQRVVFGHPVFSWRETLRGRILV